MAKPKLDPSTDPVCQATAPLLALLDPGAPASPTAPPPPSRRQLPPTEELETLLRYHSACGRVLSSLVRSESAWQYAIPRSGDPQPSSFPAAELLP